MHFKDTAALTEIYKANITGKLGFDNFNSFWEDVTVCTVGDNLFCTFRVVKISARLDYWYGIKRCSRAMVTLFDWSEWSTCGNIHVLPFCRQKAFKMMDSANSGYFNSYELRNALDSLGQFPVLHLLAQPICL